MPYPAGGTADVMPRIVADWLSRKWGQSVIIENRTGAGGNIGAEVVAKVRPRRLHAAGLAAGAAGHQSEPLPASRLRPAAIRADRSHGPRAERARGQPRQDQSQHGEGFHRLCEGQSRQDHGCHPGQRHDLASDLGAVSADGARQAAERAVSRLGAGAQRSGRRQRRLHVRQSRRVDAVRESRQAETDCGRLAGTRGIAAERADHRRDLAGLCAR